MELGLLSRLLPVHLVLEMVLDVWVTEPHLVLDALHLRQPITIVHCSLARFRYLRMRNVMQSQLTSPLPIIARRPTPFRHAEYRQLRAGATLTHLAAVSLPRPLRTLDSTVPNSQELPTNKIQLRLLAATLQTPIIYITMILFSTQGIPSRGGGGRIDRHHRARLRNQSSQRTGIERNKLASITPPCGHTLAGLRPRWRGW